MPSASSDFVLPIRHASRKLVRELGFMRKTLADTSFSAAAVHCLVEIGDHNVTDSVRLCEILMVSEDELAEILQELMLSGEVNSEPTAPSCKGSQLSLTAKGVGTLSSVNAFAVNQVQKALDKAPANAPARIAEAILLYAEALEAGRNTGSFPLQPKQRIEIHQGYRPGILGRTLEMHLNYYSKTAGFGLFFETKLASGFADLLNRLENPVNQVWTAVETDQNGNEWIVGSIFIDGEDLGDKSKAHLRGFIVDDHVRGRGVGRKLLREALGFVDQGPFAEVKLWTMDGLDAARHLYEAFGFVLVNDSEQMQWAQSVRVLEYVRVCVKSGDTML